MTIINLFINQTSDPERCRAIVQTIKATLIGLGINVYETIIGVHNINPTFNDNESTAAPYIEVRSGSDEETDAIIEALQIELYCSRMHYTTGPNIRNFLKCIETPTD